jgi:hypothetical protein
LQADTADSWQLGLFLGVHHPSPFGFDYAEDTLTDPAKATVFDPIRLRSCRLRVMNTQEEAKRSVVEVHTPTHPLHGLPRALALETPFL